MLFHSEHFQLEDFNSVCSLYVLRIPILYMKANLLTGTES
jgi:hypothetical protein